MLRGRIVVVMLIRTNLLIALRDSANDGELGRTVNPLPLGLVGSNPTYPTSILNFKNMDGGEISIILICAIPVVAIICGVIKECFRIKYNKDDKNF